MQMNTDLMQILQKNDTQKDPNTWQFFVLIK